MQFDISIVIVNYNVRHFLQQSLESVERATVNLNVETWVVDNNSIDDSVSMVKESFPSVKLIENKDNPGFSIANNQAIKRSNAKYVLLLNPDTVLQEDTLQFCLDFMNANVDCGAVGAKMIDGSGNFLPESKRGFPSPWVSFCKALGLSSMFPKSKLFNTYHLGFLDENEVNEVDVLCGAFMFMRKTVLDQVGLLDEAFFMYGEDIDLSYRIKKAGHKIFYLPETQLIHFKGESTKKTSINYVRVFYQAMIIFVKKHFSGRGAGLLLLLLNVAIIGRGTLSILRRFISRFIFQLADFILIYGGLILLKNVWESFYFKDSSYFSDKVYIYLLVISLVYIFVNQIVGVYRRYYKIGQLIRSILTSLVLLLAVYGLLPVEFRFSRAMILFSGIWSMLIVLLLRFVYSYAKNGDFRIGKEKIKRIFLFGSQPEIKRVERLLEATLMKFEIKGRISPTEDYDSTYYDGNFSKVMQLAAMERVNEFVFCMRDLKWENVMKLMRDSSKEIEYKMVGDEHLSILGSKSKNSSGELYSVQFEYNLNKRNERIKKRLLDIIISILVFLLFPITMCFFLIKKDVKISESFSKLWMVLIGKRTIVGYRMPDIDISDLPYIKDSIIKIGPKRLSDQNLIHRANTIYAKEYSVWRDVELIITRILS